MNYSKSLIGASLVGLLQINSAAIAEENLWLYAKGSDTRPQGSIEVKSSDIFRTGKAASNYDFHDLRLEAEYGLTDKLTVGAEIMVFRHDYEVFDEDLEPYIETQGGLGSQFKDTQFAGYELALKYNLLSPYKDGLGLSLGLAYERRDVYRLDGAEIDQDSIVVSAFMQKNYLDDTLTLALNPKVEYERRSTPGVFEEELAIDIAAGISYRFKPRWFAGLEFRHQSDYLNPLEDGVYDPDLQITDVSLSNFKFSVGSQHQRGNYFGPTVHYAAQRWWATAGALYQFDGQGNAPGVNNIGGKNFDEHERWHIGLSFGWEFGKEEDHDDFEL